MSISETAKEALKAEIRITVKEAIDSKVYPPAADDGLEEGYKKKAKKEADDVDVGDEDEVEEADESDDEDESESESDEEDEDESPVEESMTVTAMPNGGKKKAQTLSARNHRDLVRLAKTGKYEYFTVKKKDGSEVEYMIDRGKLVEM